MLTPRRGRSWTTAATTDNDWAAIESVLANVEDGFNTNDAELSCRDFTANARTITALGSRVAGVGRPFWTPTGPGSPDRSVTSTPATGWTTWCSCAPTSPLALKQAWATDASGTARTADPAMVALYVLVREQGRWWIAARANTLVQPAVDRS